MSTPHAGDPPSRLTALIGQVYPACAGIHRFDRERVDGIVYPACAGIHLSRRLLLPLLLVYPACAGIHLRLSK